MPTYEYRCRNCNHNFEIVQSFKDDALTVCPECQGELRKVFGAVGVAFKGAGFYKTDNRSSGSSGSSGSSSSTSSSSSSDSSSSSASSSSTDSGSSHSHSHGHSHGPGTHTH